MASRLQFYASSLLLVWLLLPLSLFCCFDFGSSPVDPVGHSFTHNTRGISPSPFSTPLAFHCVCFETPNWVRKIASPSTTPSPCKIDGRGQSISTGGDKSCCSLCESRDLVRTGSLNPWIVLHLFKLQVLAIGVGKAHQIYLSSVLDALLPSLCYWKNNSSGHYHLSSIPLCHLEKVLKRIMCSGPPENLIVIPEKHLTGSSLMLDETSFQETQSVTSSHSLRFEFISCRLCSPLWKSEKSTSETIGLSPVLSLLVDHAEGPYSPNPSRDSKPSHSFSRQDRYNLPTPIVLNLNSKFTVDFGVLHGINSVMVEGYLSSGICIWWFALSCDCNNHHCPSLRDRYHFHMLTVLNLLIKLFLVNFGLSLHGFEDALNTAVTIGLSPIISDWRLSLIFDQVCYRVRAALFTGCNISVSFPILLEESLEGLQHLTSLAMRIMAKTPGIGDKLMRSVHMKLDFGPCLTTSDLHSYLLDQKTIHRSFQIKWIQMDQRFYLCNCVTGIWNLFLCLLCKRKVESLSFHFPIM